MLTSFLRQNSGIAAVEFALIFPITVMIYFGVTELSHGYNVHRKTYLAANMVADLVSQRESVTPGDIDDIATGVLKLLDLDSNNLGVIDPNRPNADPVRVAVYNVVGRRNGNSGPFEPIVDWGYSADGGWKFRNGSVLRPSKNFLNTIALNENYIFAVVRFNYEPRHIAGKYFKNRHDIVEWGFRVPRGTAPISCSGCT